MQTVANNKPALERPSRAPKVVALVLLLLLAGLLWRHAGDLGMYSGYLLERRPVAKLGINELSPLLDEAALQKHVAGVPLRCTGELRVCRADISRMDNVPAMQLAAFFDQGRLVNLQVDVPWWAHHAALRQLVTQFGAPEALYPATAARPQVQWRTRGGWVTLQKSPGFDPLQPVALQWRADVPKPPAP